MKLLFKLASRSRPQKFFSCLENIRTMIDDKANYIILASDDEDDSTMQTGRIEKYLSKVMTSDIKFTMYDGKSKNKVDAINRDINRFGKTYDIIVNTSDDMNFIQKGFDNIIREDFIKYFPDLDGFLAYNDGNQKSNVCTMSIMGRKYYERFNYIYNPAYQSVWCDVEATEVAYMLGKYRYMGDENILFRHLHPAWGLAEYDEQYRKSDDVRIWSADLQTLLERRARNYDLKKEEIVNPFFYGPDRVAQWKSELNNARMNQGLHAIKF